MKYITKRDGSKEPYNIGKIQNVIQKAFSRTDENSEENIQAVLTYFINHFSALKTVEEIQDAVEKSLMAKKFFKTAKEFILYRKQRENIRNSKTSLTKTFREVLSADGSDISRENANVDGKAPMGLMLLFGSEIEKDYVKRYMISPRFTELHESGDIHIHDLNMYACTFNCCNIGLKDLLGKGFNTGHGNIREPQSIQSAMSLTAIIVQANQNDMFGGQGIPLWDYELTKYVSKSFGKRLKEVLEIYLGYDLKDNTITDFVDAKFERSGTVLGDLDDVKSFISFLGKENTDKIVSKAVQLTKKDVYQACEGFVHNLNTLNSRCGSQVPFSSINYGTCTTEEGRLLIKSILKATEQGLGNHETPIFPVQIFKVKEGINANPEDPNYDLFTLACKVSAKRMYPNFVNIDVPGNIEYYEEGKPETEMATMGALDGNEHLYVKINNGNPVDITIKELYTFCKTGVLNESRPCELFFNKEPLNNKGDRTKQFPTNIEPGAGVYAITYLPEDVTYIGSSSNVCQRFKEHRSSIRRFGSLGTTTYFGDDNPDNYKFEVLEYTDNFEEREKHYIQTIPNINFKGLSKRYYKQCGSYNHIHERPNFKQDLSAKQDLIDTKNLDIMVLDRGLKWVKMNHIFKNDRKNTPNMMYIFYKDSDKEYCLKCTEDHPLYIGNETFRRADELKIGDTIYRADGKELTISEISWSFHSVDSYDIGTVTGSFIGSDIIMHNCRTKVLSRLDGSARTTNRGNIAFCTINLPRLGILADHSVDKFFEMLDQRITDCIDELMERVKFLCTKKVCNFPFLMGQNIYLGAENLGWNDSIEPALRNGTLAVGFIGIAEALVALTGKHHGESDECYELALKIVQKIRDRTDKATEDLGWQFGCFATPAEGLSERFVKIDKKKFGIIEGVTDRQFYSNSFHIPVYFPITATRKMQLEGRFHEICNAGAITYVEMDGDPSQNLDAFEKLVHFSRKCGISYFSINHDLDRCPICGFQGIIPTDTCPNCGWKEGTEIDVQELKDKGLLKHL